MVALEEGALSYERSTPVRSLRETRGQASNARSRVKWHVQNKSGPASGPGVQELIHKVEFDPFINPQLVSRI